MLGIPLKYNVRNLFVRKVTTTLTVLGIALVVAVFLCVMALGEGLTNVFAASGSEKNVLVLRQNSQSELQSGLGRDQIPLIRALPGIEKDADDRGPFKRTHSFDLRDTTAVAWSPDRKSAVPNDISDSAAVHGELYRRAMSRESWAC